MQSKLAELERRIADLEAQLAAMQAQSYPHTTTLVAPIRVVNQAGQLLAILEQQTNDLSLRLFNQQGITVASLGVDGTQAGYLAIRNAEGVLIALLDVETWGARLQLEDHARSGGVVIFGGDAGEDAGGGIQVHHSAGGISITLWSTPEGGAVTVYDGQPEQTVLGSIPSPESKREH